MLRLCVALVILCPGRTGLGCNSPKQSCLRAGRVLKSISLLCSDSERGGRAGNDNFHQVLDTPLNLQALQVLLGFLSPATLPKELSEMDERQPRITRAFSLMCRRCAVRNVCRWEWDKKKHNELHFSPLRLGLNASFLK